MGSIVWVLGAGFSRSLGGPLLPQLLSRQSWGQMEARYPEQARLLLGRKGTPHLQQILRDFGWEADSRTNQVFGDAEQFLEHLDAAALPGGDGARNRLGRLLGMDVSVAHAGELAACAKRAVAMQCCAFMDDHPLDGERWEPYLGWAGALDPQDVVVTFNYDRVVEEAARAAGRTLDVVVHGGQRVQGAPKLLKLHGSVDWCLLPTGGVRAAGDPEYALSCGDEQLAIASPGPGKRDWGERMVHLRTQAADAIKAATAVVFAGYRFPPSDAQSRSHLLGSLSSSGVSIVAVHTVLGPRTGDSDTTRMEQLLHHALQRGHRKRTHPTDVRPQGGSERTYSLKVQPLYAEDFIGLVSRFDIENAYRFG